MYSREKITKVWFRHPGFGGTFGKWFGPGFGPGGFGAARFERGELKLVILDLLKEKPRHGYDIIQALEKRFHGFYSPSPGSVYPILQLLEDQDFVKSEQQSEKRCIRLLPKEKALSQKMKKKLKQCIPG